MNYAANCYKAICLRVIDGDTVHLLVDLGLRVRRETYVRLAGIDAPETRGKNKEKGRAAKSFLESLLMQADLVVSFEKGKSFDRWVGSITAVNGSAVGVDVQHEMVKAGHAVVSEA